MPTTAKSGNRKPNRLKWAPQQVGTLKPSNRVHKRTISRHRKTSTTSNTASPTFSGCSAIQKLEADLAFSNDTLATIMIMFDSLRHAYTTHKAEMDRSSTTTRMGEMERELLVAYDDLGLQVSHLEKRISKLEKELQELKDKEKYLSFAQATSTPLEDGERTPTMVAPTSLSDDLCLATPSVNNSPVVPLPQTPETFWQAQHLPIYTSPPSTFYDTTPVISDEEPIFCDDLVSCHSVQQPVVLPPIVPLPCYCHCPIPDLSSTL